MATKLTRVEEESIIYGDRYTKARKAYQDSIKSQLPAPEIGAFLKIYRDNQCDPNRRPSDVNTNVLTAGFIAASSESDCLPVLASILFCRLTDEQVNRIRFENKYDHGDPDIEGHMVNEFFEEFETMAMSAVDMLRARTGQYGNLRITDLYKRQYDAALAHHQDPPDPMAPISGVGEALMFTQSPQALNDTRGVSDVHASAPFIEELTDEEIDADLV